MKSTKPHGLTTLIFLVTLFFQSHAVAAEDVNLATGQTLYLPVYSYIWHGDRVVSKRYPLKTPVSALVSIRNTNLKTPIRLFSAHYFDTNGKLLKQLVTTPVTIEPLCTHELFIEKQETQGGSGANLILQWDAAVPVNPPIVEAIHAEIKGHSTFTFVTQAQTVNGEK
jgi:hypothetical protein